MKKLISDGFTCGLYDSMSFLFFSICFSVSILHLESIISFLKFSINSSLNALLSGSIIISPYLPKRELINFRVENDRLSSLI